MEKDRLDELQSKYDLTTEQLGDVRKKLYEMRDAQAAANKEKERLGGITAAEAAKQAEINGEYNKLMDNLDQQVNKLKLSGQAYEVYAANVRRAQLAEQGFSEEQILSIMNSEATIKSLERRAKEQEEAEKKRQEIMERGKQLTDSLMTPQETFNAAMEEYNSLLSSGAISQETFNRAVTQAKEQLGEASSEANKYLDLINSMSSSGNVNSSFIGLQRDIKTSLNVDDAQVTSTLDVRKPKDTEHQNKMESLMETVAETNETIAEKEPFIIEEVTLSGASTAT